MWAFQQSFEAFVMRFLRFGLVAGAIFLSGNGALASVDEGIKTLESGNVAEAVRIFQKA